MGAVFGKELSNMSGKGLGVVEKWGVGKKIIHRHHIASIHAGAYEGYGSQGGRRGVTPASTRLRPLFTTPADALTRRETPRGAARRRRCRGSEGYALCNALWNALCNADAPQAPRGAARRREAPPRAATRRDVP